ncbi:MAG: c-type cytochrome [Planctomycetota bacterium]|jgi:mono/diheme cytochrome c family protein
MSTSSGINMKSRSFGLFLASGLLLLASCRGGISKSPPVHIVDDMDVQLKVKAQSRSAFDFAAWNPEAAPDHMGMRIPPAGTVARGSLERMALSVYKDAAGNFIDNPVPITAEVLARGRERFDIMCSVCHDRAGSGLGLVQQRAPQGSFNPKMPDLATEQRIRDMKDGELYSIIVEGKATMPAYVRQIKPDDRWAIVHYLRALQHRIKN